MKANLLLLFILLICRHIINAQPCENPQAGLTCYDAPVLCNIYDLDGFCSTLPDFPNPTGPSPFCNANEISTNTIWFGFIAGSNNLGINIIPSKCTPVGGQTGIHGGIYSGDCSNIMPVICQECSASMINLSTNALVPGNVYWLVMDGCNGSVCDITVDILSGSEPSMLGDLGPISGPIMPCVGSTENYMFELIPGASYYKWSFDNLNDYCTPTFFAADTNRVAVKFDSIGTYQLCYEAGSGCVTKQKCIDITVESGPVGIDPATVKTCKHGGYLYNGNEYLPGRYTIKLQSNKGCDSIITLTIDTLPDIQNDIGIIYKCKNDCLTIQDTFGNGGVYCDEADNAKVVLQSWKGCDSVVSFTLKVIDLKVVIEPPYDIGCTVNQTPLDGTSTLINLSNYSNLNIKWTALNGGVIQGPDDNLVISTEFTGKYCLTVEAVAPDGMSVCKDSACVIVKKDPTSPIVSIVGNNISCANNTATLTGISSYNGSIYIWKGPNGESYTSKTVSVVNPGVYILTVIAPNFCSDTTSFKVETEYKQKLKLEKDTFLCFGEFIQLNNDSLTAPFNYAYNKFSNDTCYTFDYHLKLKNTEDLIYHICPGQSFMFYNTLIDVPGVYEIHSIQSTGCDSIYYLTVIEDPIYNTTININVKMGDLYNGQIILNDTVITDVLKNQFGCDSTVITAIHVTTSTNNLNKDIDISIVPNPAKKLINITSKQLIEIESYEIISSIGQSIIKFNQKSTLPIQLNIGSLPDGIYLIKLKSKEGVLVKSFIKEE